MIRYYVLIPLTTPFSRSRPPRLVSVRPLNTTTATLSPSCDMVQCTVAVPSSEQRAALAALAELSRVLGTSWSR